MAKPAVKVTGAFTLDIGHSGHSTIAQVGSTRRIVLDPPQIPTFVQLITWLESQPLDEPGPVPLLSPAEEAGARWCVARFGTCLAPV